MCEEPNATYLDRIDPRKVTTPPQPASKTAMHPADVFASTERMHLSYVNRGNRTMTDVVRTKFQERRPRAKSERRASV